MKTTFFPSLSREASRIGLGCMRLHPDREAEAEALIDTYRKWGGNLFDTAEVYGGGQSEVALGNYFRKHGGRSDAIVVTKGCVDSPLVRPDYIRGAIVRSLERLQSDYIDLYLLHRDDPSVPVSELVDTLDDAVRQGKIRAFGGSNWSTARLEAANEYARANLRHGFTASSPHLALATPREPWWSGCNHATAEDLKYYAKTRMPILAWSSQCRGFFSKEPIVDMAYLAEVIRVYYTTENLSRRERLFALAKERNVDPSALAVAYVTSLPLSTIALVGPLSVADLGRAMTTVDWELSAKEIAWLESGKD
jgi:aryl-alcohol dehydrogenase-like predicted oxidoreductase